MSRTTKTTSKTFVTLRTRIIADTVEGKIAAAVNMGCNEADVRAYLDLVAADDMKKAGRVLRKLETQAGER